MSELQLFRVRVHPERNQQGTLANGLPPRELILRDRVWQGPSAALKGHVTWHIGNVETIDNTAVYFRLGRTTVSTNEVWSEEHGFLDLPIETSPYTHVFLDWQLEVCAIAKKPKLAPTTEGIARQFKRLLNVGSPKPSYAVEFEVDALHDPDAFIASVRQAHAVSRFWFSFKRPNAFDVNKDIVQPLQLDSSRPSPRARRTGVCAISTIASE